MGERLKRLTDEERRLVERLDAEAQRYHASHYGKPVGEASYWYGYEHGIERAMHIIRYEDAPDDRATEGETDG